MLTVLNSIFKITKEDINGFNDSHKKKIIQLFHFIALCGFTYGYSLLIIDHLGSNYIPILFTIYILHSSIKIVAVYLIIALLLYNSIGVKLNIYYTIFLIVVSYLLTDLSHYLFSEPTYSSKYKNKKNIDFMYMKFKHHLYLPLFILNSILFKPCYFSSGHVKINEKVLNNIDINTIDVKKKFTNKKIDKELAEKLYHNTNLDNDISKIIKSFLLEHRLNHNYERLDNMDELYITNPSFKALKIDKVVDDYHIDGHIPNILGIKTYRLLILLQKDEKDKSRTLFKHHIPSNNSNYIIFDYNGQVHRAYIPMNTLNNITKKRVLLKIHYITYPHYMSKKMVEMYKYMVIKTNRLMRQFQNKNKNNYFTNVLHVLKRDLLKPIEIV